MQHIYNVEIGETAVTGIQPPHTMLNEGIQGRVGLLRARDVNGELSRKQGYRQLSHIEGQRAKRESHRSRAQLMQALRSTVVELDVEDGKRLEVLLLSCPARP